GRRVCTGLPADCRSTGVRHPAAAEEDPPQQQLQALRSTDVSEAIASLAERLVAHFQDRVRVTEAVGQVTLETGHEHWLDVARVLRDEFGFEQLVDLCGVDYLGYGAGEWDVSD